MNSAIQAKLAILKDEYKKHLPEKIADIEKMWVKLVGQFDHELLVTLHRKVHSIHGSSTTYGFNKLGEMSAEIEKILNAAVNSEGINKEQKEKLTILFNDIKHPLVLDGDLSQNIFKLNKPENNNFIYILSNEKYISKEIIPQLNNFGYSAVCFQNQDEFVDAVNKNQPSVLIINTSMINDTIIHFLQQLNKDENVLIFFESSTAEFSQRLKAVKLGSKGYFLKPIIVEELVTQIDKYIKFNGQSCRAIIVDDEIETAQYHATILNAANIETKIVTNFEEVDDALHQFKPDILLIDLYMPGCNGLELATIIRQQSAYEGIPIVFLSSEEDKMVQLQTMRQGVDDFINKSIKPEYLVMTVRNRALRYKTLNTMMVKDNLTNVYNHSFIMHQLDIELNETKRLHNSMCVVMIDLDNFKHINDTYTHLAGDQVLRSLCLMLRNRLRNADLVGRYGGEEFIIILPNTEIDAAAAFINDIREQFSMITYTWNNQLFNSTFSAGIAAFPDFLTVHDIVTAADKSLYKAKNTGRNLVVTYS